MSDSKLNEKREQLRERIRKLILMRETGPKRAGWHAARARLIWRLHEELQQTEEEAEATRRELNPPH